MLPQCTEMLGLLVGLRVLLRARSRLPPGGATATVAATVHALRAVASAGRRLHGVLRHLQRFQGGSPASVTLTRGITLLPSSAELERQVPIADGPNMATIELDV